MGRGRPRAYFFPRPKGRFKQTAGFPVFWALGPGYPQVPPKKAKNRFFSIFVSFLKAGASRVRSCQGGVLHPEGYPRPLPLLRKCSCDHLRYTKIFQEQRKAASKIFDATYFRVASHTSCRGQRVACMLHIVFGAWSDGPYNTIWAYRKRDEEISNKIILVYE